MANITKGTSSWNVNVEPGETVTLNTGKSYVDRNIAVYAAGGYLPLAGGTLTGKITMKGSDYEDKSNTGQLNMNNSDIYGINSLKFADLCDTAAEGIQWYRDSTHTDSLWVKNGVINFSPNRPWGATDNITNYTIIHSGNIGLQSVSDSAKVNGHTVNSDVPANAKFTDTNTWRGIQNNLTSDSTSDSLSAAQGKALKGLIDELPSILSGTDAPAASLGKNGDIYIKLV